MKNEHSGLQVLRELCVALTLVSLGCSWWILLSGGNIVVSQALMETALVCIIAGETYAKD